MNHFFRRSRADNSKVGGGIWPKFDLILDFIHILVTRKNEDDLIKNLGARVVKTFSHYKSIGIVPDVQRQLTPQSLVRFSHISNPFETLLSFIPAKMKYIRSKMKALECS